MNCNSMREKLHDDKWGFSAAAMWLHLFYCYSCRAEARALRNLQQTLQNTERLAPSADLLPHILAVSDRDAAAYIKQKEGRKMKRIAFVIAAMLLITIGAAVIVPSIGKNDARALLISVAKAMEEARSVHITGHAATPDKKSPTGMKMDSGQVDIWLSEQIFYLRHLLPDGKMDSVVTLDANSGKWLVYETKKGKLLRGDLKSLGNRATGFILDIGRQFLSGQIIATMVTFVPGTKEEVTTEMRDGKEVKVITATFKNPTLRDRIDKLVIEVDPANNHLFTFRQYARTAKIPYKMITVFEKIEYDVPVPDSATELEVPAGIETEEATVVIKQTDKLKKSLILKTEKEEIGRFDLPKK